MAESNFHGPLSSMGSLEDGANGPLDGATVLYQGAAIPDPRYSPFRKDGMLPGRVPSFFISPAIVNIDAIPSATSTTTIASAQVATAATLMVLNTTAVGGVTPGARSLANVPIIPFNGSSPINVLAIDFGFTTSTTTANSSTLPVPDSTLFAATGWYVIGGVGNVGKTVGLVTQCQTVLNATTIQVLPAPLATLVNAPIGRGNVFGSEYTPPATQFGPSASVANAAQPYQPNGLALLFDPQQGITRNISVTTNSSIGTSAVVVSGYDIYGVPMTETLTAIGTTTIYGKKAFKYISGITPNTTQTAVNFTIGVGDVYGFCVRTDKWEYTQESYAGVAAITANGFTAAFTGVSTSTTGDVRGTIQLSTAGSLGTSFGTTSNGTSRLWISADIPQWNVINANAVSTSALFGSAQA